MNINFKRISGIYMLEAEQHINSSIQEVWNFFSDPKNLSKITPPHMKFEITNGDPVKMYEGQIISYKVNILPGIKTNWVTEISNVKEHRYFIDNQITGPYKLWHHQHIFKETQNGILMNDIVSFKLPMGFFGYMGSSFIKEQLFKIFKYRINSINHIFN